MRKSPITYHGQSEAEFYQAIADEGVTVQAEVAETLLPPNGIYVSPETKNSFYAYSNGEVDGFRYEQFVTSYYQDLALTAEFFAAVFAIELPRPTVPVYVSSRTTFTANSILGYNAPPVLKGIQSINLEGDFSEFFVAYSRDQHALDAFITIVPNLMVDMLASGSQYDVEFADRYVYFYRLYSPTNSSDGKVSISLSAQDYARMRNFGLKYGKAFVRAALPSTGDTAADTRPLWQLVNEHQATNNIRQFVWLIGILSYMVAFAFLWFVVVPVTVIWFGVRYVQWVTRRKRLLTRWAGRI